MEGWSRRVRTRVLIATSRGVRRRDKVRRTYLRKDGSTFDVEVVRQVVASPDGAIVVAIARDLTRRFAAQSQGDQRNTPE